MIALTRTVGPKACASPTVIAFTPALAAAYGTMSRVGRTAPVLETLMIEPPPAATIRSPTSAASRNGPFRLTAIDLVEELLGDVAELARTAARRRRC